MQRRWQEVAICKIGHSPGQYLGSQVAAKDNHVDTEWWMSCYPKHPPLLFPLNLGVHCKCELFEILEPTIIGRSVIPLTHHNPFNVLALKQICILPKKSQYGSFFFSSYKTSFIRQINEKKISFSILFYSLWLANAFF